MFRFVNKETNQFNQWIDRFQYFGKDFFKKNPDLSTIQ